MSGNSSPPIDVEAIQDLTQIIWVKVRFNYTILIDLILFKSQPFLLNHNKKIY